MRFDLVDLRLFVAVAEAGSITAGAQTSNMSLASASARLTGMENRLGVALLERSRRGVVPTTAGLALLGHARAINARTTLMRDELASFANGLRGEVRLLSNTAALVQLVPAALAGYLSEHPEVDVRLEEKTSIEIVLAVADGQSDIGVIASSADSGNLETVSLTSDRLVAVASAGHPLEQAGPVRFATLLDQPFVGLLAGALCDHLASKAAQLGRRIDYRVRLKSFGTMATLVSTGVGIAVMPEAVLSTARVDGLAMIHLDEPWCNRKLLACARSFADLAPSATSLLNSLVAAGTN